MSDAKAPCSALATLAAVAAAGMLSVAGCQTTPPALHFAKPLVLLGEVHDNAVQHRLRLAAFEDLLARGARPALLMEQFDAERQPAIDAARAAGADAVIAAGRAQGSSGTGGRVWAHYRPFIERALAHQLPIVAVNVGRDEARRVMREGLAAHGFDAAVPSDVIHGLAALIVAGHCGAIGIEPAKHMALAQVARDQRMARAVAAHAAGGVVLLAGNGHVRTDFGLTRWLPGSLRAQSEAIGMLEDGDVTRAYDRIVFTAPHPRADPCAAFKAASAPAPAAQSHVPALAGSPFSRPSQPQGVTS